MRWWNGDTDAEAQEEEHKIEHVLALLARCCWLLLPFFSKCSRTLQKKAIVYHHIDLEMHQAQSKTRHLYGSDATAAVLKK